LFYGQLLRLRRVFHGAWAGRQHTLFNSESQVFVGGKKDAMGTLVRSFRGTIAGEHFKVTPA
jgi:hypothetical protein